MPQDLQAIVQRMLDANEPEENIASVIRHAKAQEPRGPSEPDTYSGGFLKGLGEGAAGGAKGFARGVVKSPMALLSGLAQTVAHPAQTVKGLAQIPSAVRQAVSRAATDPERWGEGVGSLTGQTLLTGGAPKFGPPILRGGARAAGAGLTEIGRRPWMLGAGGMYTGGLPGGLAATAAAPGFRAAGQALTRLGTKASLPPPFQIFSANAPRIPAKVWHNITEAAANKKTAYTTPVDLKRLVHLAEEVPQVRQAAKLAQQGASEQGMRYAAYGKTGKMGGSNRRVSALPRFGK